jgi:hypothetical protein
LRQKSKTCRLRQGRHLVCNLAVVQSATIRNRSMVYKLLPTQGPASETPALGADVAWSAASVRTRRDLWISLLLGLACLLIYNANLRSISAGDTYASRYQPFAILRYHTLLLDPISSMTSQGRKIAVHGGPSSAYWVVPVRDGHDLSLYPVVLPLLVTPFYLPAVAYLDARGWDQLQVDRIARIMEKICASLLAATAAALLYLLLRRRTEPLAALLLTLVFALGTTTWVISSQALWSHGLAELLIVAALLLLTGPRAAGRALVAGCLCGLIACNRPPDAILAAGLGLYGLWWAGRLAPLLVAGAMLPVGLVLIYNVGVVGNLAGAYAIIGDATFLQHDLLSGLAGLLFSPTRGLFIFSPFLLFLLFGLPQVLSDRRARGLTAAIGIAAVLQLLLYAMADWRQGASWGPRWLTDVLPILFWMLAPVVSGLRGAGRVAFLSACGVAIAIQAVGAFWYTGASDAAILAVAKGPDQMRAAWDPRNAPFIAELRHARAPAELAIEWRGYVDSVTMRESAGGEIAAGTEIDVVGWAITAGRSPSEVIVLLDGLPGASTASFSTRPDVASALGYASPSGWQVAVPTHELTPGEHVVAALVRAYQGGDLRLLGERRFTVPAVPQAGARQVGRDQTALSPAALRSYNDASADLAVSARTAAAFLASRQQPPGYWLTSYSEKARFENPGVELNTFLNSVMIDILDPVATSAGVGENLERARRYLAGQIESDGLVRYHGRRDASTIGTLGCAITPDADDTSLVWRIAPGRHAELLPIARATLDRFRTPDGLYRTWLAPSDRYQCVVPGTDPNPADVGIQMHVLMFLAQADPPAAAALCGALERAIDEDRIWVYYASAPLLPILRQADLQKAGCPLQLPPRRLRTLVTGQEVWLAAAQLLQRVLGPDKPPAADVVELLGRLARDDFSYVRQSPPLLYHNDPSSPVPRYYWSEEFGYALWLRLYFENERLHPDRACRGQNEPATCGER